MTLINGFVHQPKNPYGPSSAERLNACSWAVRRTMVRAADFADISILCGGRGYEEQEKAFRDGKSQVHFPFSDHNITPERPLSDAVDAGLWRPDLGNVDYDDAAAFGTLNGIIQVCAGIEGCFAVWGHNWDNDQDFRDQEFFDKDHWLILEIEEAERRGYAV